MDVLAEDTIAPIEPIDTDNTQLLGLYKKLARPTDDLTDNRGEVLDQITETFGSSYESSIYGLLVGLRDAEFIKNLPEEAQEKAVETIIKLSLHVLEKAKQEGHNNINIESLPLQFDIFLEPKYQLYNPDADTILHFLDDSEQFMAKITPVLPAADLIANAPPVALRSVGDLFRLHEQNFATLHELLTTDPPINERDENILDFIRPPDVVKNTHMSLLGVKDHHKKQSETVNTYDLAFKEWAHVFSEPQDGEAAFKTFAQMVKHIHTNGYSNNYLFEQVNPDMKSYAAQPEDTLQAEHVNSKQKLLKVLALTNQSSMAPQFVIRNLNTVIPALTDKTDVAISSPESVLTPELKSEYFSYLVRESNQFSRAQLMDVFTEAKAIFGNAWPDIIKPSTQLDVSLRQLFMRDDPQLVEFIFDTFPQFKDSLAHIDESLAQKPGYAENAFIWYAPQSAESLRKLYPKVYALGQKFLNEQLRFEIMRTSMTQKLLDQATDSGSIASLRKAVEYKHDDIEKYIQRLFVFEPQDRNWELASYLINEGYAKEWFSVRNLFTLPKEVDGDIRVACIRSGSIEAAYYFESQRTGKTDNISRNLGSARKLFGDRISIQLYQAIDNIYEGVIPADLTAIGVKGSGTEGISQLKQAITKIKTELGQNKIPDALGENAFVNEFVFKFLRIGLNRYGIQTVPELVDKVRIAREAATRPTDADFESDKQYQVAKLEKSNHEYKISDDLKGSIDLLNQNINQAREYKRTSGELTLVATIQQKVAEKIESNKAALERIDKPQAQAVLKTTIAELSAINIQNLDSVMSQLAPLLKLKELTPLVRTAIIMKALKNDADLTQLLQFASDDTQDASEKLALLSETIRTEIIGEEIMQQLNDEPDTVTKINTIFYLNAIADELKRARALMQKSNTVSMDFVHSQGILLEFSGELADSCWAHGGTVRSIAGLNPNVHALIHRLNPGTDQEALVGATLIIETTTAAGEKILILRGDNPQQTFINSIDLESYHQAILERAKEIARKKHCKIAIALGTSSGQATTNRPAYFQYLHDTYANHQVVNLNQSGDNTFNGYVIHTNYCRMIDDFAEKKAEE
ncbi:MAG: hypothetical protein ACEQSA_00780 [Weeksellaceae bacterium]